MTPGDLSVTTSVARPQGAVRIASIVDDSGVARSFADAVRYGWISPGPVDIGADGREVEDANLFLDQGRQALAFLFGGRSPMTNFTVASFSVGTGLTPAKVTDVALEAPIYLASTSAYTKPVDSVDYLSPFVVRVAFTLGTNDANGNLISEMGLISGGGALIARKIRSVSINKQSSYSVTLSWKIRF